MAKHYLSALGSFILTALILTLGPIAWAIVNFGLKPGLWPFSARYFIFLRADLRAEDWLFGTLLLPPVPDLVVYISAATAILPILAAYFDWMAVDRHRVHDQAEAVHGDSRWASPSELRHLRFGIELGRVRGRIIASKIEGNVTVVGQQRSGKGLFLIANLLARPDDKGRHLGWRGPVFVIDPKGESLPVVRRHREALGRKVVVLDFINAHASNTYNPLDDVNTLAAYQRLAADCLPARKGDDGNEYFYAKGADIIVAAIVFAKRTLPRPTLVDVRRIMLESREFRDYMLGLQGDDIDAIREAKSTFDKDPRTRDAITATAELAFSWLADSERQRIVQSSEFSLRQIFSNKADFFLSIRQGDLKGMAPFVRTLMSIMFSIADEVKARSRILMVVDEARSLGTFPSLLTAMSSLPGQGISILTIWQFRGQYCELYGANAASIFEGAEVFYISAVAGSDEETAEWVSKTAGTYTARHFSKSFKIGFDDTTSVTSSLLPSRLMSPSAVKALPRSNAIVFINSDKRNMKVIVEKTIYFNDFRFAGLFEQNRKVVGKSV